MRSMLIAIGAAALLAASPPPAGATKPGLAAPPPGGFRHAYAHRDCAPWDGAALRIVIQQAPVPSVPSGASPRKFLPAARFPRYDVALWRGSPKQRGWIVIPGGEGMGNGHIGYQAGERQSTQLQGRILIEDRTSTRIRGELRLTHPGGEVVLPFTAPLLPYVALCG